MTYWTYDPEKDPTGEIGHALAEARYNELGRNLNNLYEASIWPEITRIALKRFPELEKGEHILDSEVRNRLKMLREAGYPIKNYGKMNSREIWDYLREVRSDIARKAELYCPKVLEEIIMSNERRKREAQEIK